MAEIPHMPLYTSDYLGDTTHLSTEEHGGYFLLLVTLWNAGGSLPNDPKRLARIARCTAAKWKRLWPVLEPFFDVSDAQITQKRLTFERKKASEKIAKARENGKRGGRPKSLKNNKSIKADGSDPPNPEKSYPEPEPKKEITDVILSGERASAPSARVPDPPDPPKPKRTAAARGAARRTQIPDNWAPTPSNYANAAKRGLTPKEISCEADRFKFDALANDKLWKRWDFAFDKWCIKASEWKSQRTPGRSGSNRRSADGLGAFDRLAERLEGNPDRPADGADLFAPGGAGEIIEAAPADGTWTAEGGG